MSSSQFRIDLSDFDRIREVMESYAGNTEQAINDILHNQAGEMIQEQIYRLMPESKKDWKGKKPAAKYSKSLRNVTANLAVTVTTTKSYQYLYFPDDGTNTENHIGNQQFFARGGELATPDIVELCVARLSNL